MSSSEIVESNVTSADAQAEIWRVQLATGEVRALSLDALDDAFQAGIISENTPVLPPGAAAWTRLADAAGLDAPVAEPNLSSLAPVAVSMEATGNATAYTFANKPLADEAMRMDLALDDEAAFKPKRGRLYAMVGVAAVLVGGLGFAASRVASVASSSTNALSAQTNDTAAAAQPPPAAVDLNNAPAKTLTDEQKAKLAGADKAREAAAAARDAQRRKDRPSSPTRRGPREKSSQPFVNGGNKFDPLNGSL